MYRNVAFIPARGGSKSIKMKNICMLNGRPLIYWALLAAVSCKEIDAVFVSTDNEQIKSVVKNFGFSNVFVIGRTEASATDEAKTEESMLEFAEGFDFQNIILIQATSPLIKAEDLSKGIKMMDEERYDSVFSVVEQKRFLWDIDEAGFAQPKNYDPMNRPRRQDFDGYYVENGSFYITSRQRLLQSGCRISGKTGMVVMDEASYFEIDEPHDFLIAEGLLKSRPQRFGLKRIKALFTDCDGVLTDCGMYYCESGDRFKRFNAKDGMGFGLLRRKGIITGIITGEQSQIVESRAERLCLDELHMSAHDKLSVLKDIALRRGLDFSEIAYIGDDINDLDVLRVVGFSVAVADASDAAKDAAMYITKRNGGEGAVREVIDMMLEELESFSETI